MRFLHCDENMKLSIHKLISGNYVFVNFLVASFSVNSGGTEQVSADGIKFDDDSEMLGAASLYTSTNNKWAVSSSGIFISNPHGPRYTAQTETQITNTLDSELYKTARISPSSLRYYGLGLENGAYQIELHFAEVQMDDDSASWKGLGRRLFDVYIQVLQVLVLKFDSFVSIEDRFKLFQTDFLYMFCTRTQIFYCPYRKQN